MTVWDVSLHKRLRHGASHFELDVQLRCELPRVVLYGPSGAGKTQTLRMIAGISRPDAGHVRIAGRELFDQASGLCLSPQDRRLGCVFQDYALFPHLTVRQNIAFGLHRSWRNPRRVAVFGHALSNTQLSFLLGGIALASGTAMPVVQVTLQLPLLLITHDDEDLRCLAQTVVQIEGGRVSDDALISLPLHPRARPQVRPQGL